MALRTLATVALLAAASASIGRLAFERRVSAQVAALLRKGRGVAPAVLTDADLVGLPEPVQRWLRTSRVVGRERPVTVRMRQEGQFRTATGRPWMRFEAEQYVTTEPPGFVWTVTMRVALLVSLTGRDRYAEGEGSIDMRLLSLFPVACKRGGGLNQGALLRYLGEMGWYPAAAVSPRITWQALDARSARATIRDAGITASADFYFDERGRLEDVVAQRYNDATGRAETWSGRSRAFGELNGVGVPVLAEGIWKSARGDSPYVRVRVTDLEYNRPSRYFRRAQRRERGAW